MDPAFSVPVSWYDGRIAIRRNGRATWSGDGGLVLEEDTGDVVSLRFDQLRHAENRPGEQVYRRDDEPEFRLILPADLPPGLAERLPAKEHYGRLIDRFGLGKATVALAAISAAAVALVMTAPSWLGPRVPDAWERQIGDAMVGDLGNRICSTPESDAVLAGLMDRLDDGSPEIRVGIANMDMVNAVALPGGQVLLFDGLLQQAESPAEVAGVLAHEIGHVRERHVMSAMMRQFGLSILIGGAGSGLGDTIGGLASLGYSRDAEGEADEYARARLAKAEISPLGAARFFERVAAERSFESPPIDVRSADDYDESADGAPEPNGDGSEDPGADIDADAEAQVDDDDSSISLGWLKTHPEPAERARAFRAAARESDYDPALTEAEFNALKNACANDPDVEEFSFF